MDLETTDIDGFFQDSLFLWNIVHEMSIANCTQILLEFGYLDAAYLSNCISPSDCIYREYSLNIARVPYRLRGYGVLTMLDHRPITLRYLYNPVARGSDIGSAIPPYSFKESAGSVSIACTR